MDDRHKERRDKPRLAVRPLESPQLSPPGPYRVLDISGSGCLLESCEPLGDIASPIRLSLPLPKGSARNPLRARIVWKTEQAEKEEQGAFLYGLRFEEMDATIQNALRLYIDFLQRDRHLTGLDEAWRKLKSGRALPG